jgi:hypothetical protein
LGERGTKPKGNEAKGERGQRGTRPEGNEARGERIKRDRVYPDQREPRQITRSYREACWPRSKAASGGPTSATPWELSEGLSRVCDARQEVSTADAHRYTQMNRAEAYPTGEVDRDLQRDTPHLGVPVCICGRNFLLPCGNIAFGNANTRSARQNSRQEL